MSDGGGGRMRWHLSQRADPRARPLADRYYNRQKVGAPQFVPPGRCLVLLTAAADALWITSWPLPEYVKHDWPGAWVNSCFRNESSALSSELVREAVSATLCEWPAPPSGMVTFIDPTKVRRKRDFGMCFLKAGFVRPKCPVCLGSKFRADDPSVPCRRCRGTGLAFTAGGLIVLQMTPDLMPGPLSPLHPYDTLFGRALVPAFAYEV